MIIQKRHLCWIIIFGLTLLTGCTDTVTSTSLQTNVIVEPGKDGNLSTIVIVDATGKGWDISHAVHEYGFDPEKFDFGLGPFSIRPIMNPKMICPGESGYPSDNFNWIVIGTSINGDARAYRLSHMRIHEIANEQFGETHVSVAY